MILQRLVLENFRQFRGTSELRFATGAKNTTVVLGENGRGKTGLYRALMFALFGSRALSQDGEVDPKEISLTNYSAAREAAARKSTASSGVCVEFVHQGQAYSLDRKLIATFDNGRVVEQLSQATLILRGASGNCRTYDDPADIDPLVGSVLDEALREYFLFDGERINRLTQASATQRQEVKRGVRRLMTLDSLEFGVKVLNKLHRALTDEFSARATGEYAQVLSRLSELAEKIEVQEKAIAALEVERALAEQEAANLDRQLAQYLEVRPLIERRNNLTAICEKYEEDGTNVLRDLAARLATAPVLLVRGMLREVFDAIDSRKRSGEIPASIRRELIERILQEHRCICTNDVLPGSAEFEAVLKWRDRALEEIVENSALELWRLVSTLTSRFDNELSQVQADVQAYATIRNESRRVQETLASIGGQVEGIGEPEIKKLEATRNRNLTKQGELRAREDTERELLDELKAEREKRIARKVVLDREESIRDSLAQRAALVLDTSSLLHTIHEEFSGEIREKLSRLASQTLERLLDEPGRRTLRKIVIAEDFSLEVHAGWDADFLANISAGQRQLTSIAFICALIRSAGGGDLLEMPLFMDTPFGRLSRTHRDRLIAELPKMASQWVLLATDTELGKHEARSLQAGGRWGTFYRLEPGKDESTAIREISPDDAGAYLKDIEEADHANAN